MKKYQIIWAHRDGKRDEIVGDAASKAPSDVTKIARMCGYEDKYVVIPRVQNKILNLLLRIYYLVKTVHSCELDSLILLQYPCFNERIAQYLRYFLKHRCFLTIVHDMNSIREKGAISQAEVKALSIYQDIIIHSPEMKTYLKPYFSKDIKFHILGCFPYLSQSKCEEPKLGTEVCFAGNIDKSVFLHQFLPNIKNIKFKLYGRMEKQLLLGDNAQYCGMFKPDEIATLSGSWGLVWDGDSINTCSGTWGDYLRIIAPHKFSLYIAAGIPPIVWDKSAMARIVKEYGIGLTISTLNELEEVIDGVSVERYKEMLISLKIVQNKLISGYVLKSYL